MEFFLFLSVAFFLTYALGKVVERFKVPWIFSSLIIGFAFQFIPSFYSFLSDPVFLFLSQFGMFSLLFMIGFEMDLKEMKRLGRTIVKSAFIIIFLEAVVGTALIHFVFKYPIYISFIVALSFATVGEAILVPILDETGAIKTDLGKLIIGIGTADDILEIIALLLASMLISSKGEGLSEAAVPVLVLLSLFALAFILMKIKLKKKRGYPDLNVLFLIAFGVLFLFLGIGGLADSSALGAFLAGIATRTFLPRNCLKEIEKEIKAVSYGFFGPMFFLWIGISTNLTEVMANPMLVILILVITNLAKIIGSYISSKDVLGLKGSILMGIGLSVRFSTSLVVLGMLFSSGIISNELFSILIATSVAFKFVIPPLFSKLIVEWGYSKN